MVLTQREADILLSLYQLFEEKQDTEGKRTIVSLLRKLQDESLYIGFCGHFSAGKSTFINRLFGEGVLPTSPIPTSANVVQLSYGGAGTIVHMTSGETILYEGVKDKENMQALCKNGDEIVKIEMKTDNTFLGKGIVLIDTPGIDSTDDMHALATESILPAVDVLFYVMDYNHVKSQVNVAFVEKMMKRNKKCYIIVNQIDKHNEAELPFTHYRQSIIELWTSYGIPTENIFFTSLRQTENLYNDFAYVQQMMNTLVEEKGTYIKENIENELSFCLDNHLAFMKEGDSEESNINSEEYGEITKEYHRLKEFVETSDTNFAKVIQTTLNQAHFMNYDIRELMKIYLESLVPTFKVGMLFSKGKTEAERQRRHDHLLATLQELIKTQIDMPIKHTVKEFCKQYGVEEDVYGEQILLEEQFLANLVNNNAEVNHTYVVQYANNVVNAIKGIYRNYFMDYYNKINYQLKAPYEMQLDNLQEKINNMAEVIEKQNVFETYGQTLEKIKNGDIINYNHTVEELLYIPYSLSKPIIVKAEEKTEIEKVVEKVEKKENNQEALQQAKEIERLLAPVPSLTHLYETLVQKRERMENKTFTVVLFGAFSAGKSSLINALLGRKILPSSPNPTTATISHVKPPTAEYGHGTVKVIGEKEVHLISLEELEEYVANEEVAQYIQLVEIYYDCEWTRKGITVVDTPGVNSVHERHTKLAFSYMKQADAILYVTYYHHTFSRSDREFLLQLGRVKETMELDNMFFVINAADLAESAEEVTGVKQYVAGQLRKNGIMEPRLFALSSKEALAGDNLPFTAFRQSFESFLSNDLLAVANQGLRDMFTAIMYQVTEMITAMKNVKTQKDVEIQKIEKARQEAMEELANLEIDKWTYRSSLEVEELIFYVKKRVMIRFGELFTESFHPGAVQNKQALQDCLTEFIHFVENDILQELLATTLRMEKFVEKTFKEVVEGYKKNHQDITYEVEISVASPVFEKFQMEEKLVAPALKIYKNSKSFFEKNEKMLMLEKLKGLVEPSFEIYVHEIIGKLQQGYEQEIMKQWSFIQSCLQDEIERKAVQYVAMLEEGDSLVYEVLLEEMKKVVS